MVQYEAILTMADRFTHSLTAALDQLRVVASSTSNDPGRRSGQHQQIGQRLLPLGRPIWSRIWSIEWCHFQCHCKYVLYIEPISRYLIFKNVMTLRGHSGSLEITLFYRLHMSAYSYSIAAMAISYIVSKIKMNFYHHHHHLSAIKYARRIRRKSWFFIPPLYITTLCGNTVSIFEYLCVVFYTTEPVGDANLQRRTTFE